MERQEALQQVSQTAYQETPYSDATWEIVGEAIKTEDFIPITVKTVEGQDFTIDPMFPDYGGRYGQGGVPHPYLLPGEQYGAETEEEDEDVGTIKIREEELQQLLREAEERGKTEAMVQLVEENEQKMQNVESRVLSIFQDYQAQMKETLLGLERRAVELSVALSEKMIGYAVEINPEYIIPLIQEALKMVGSAHVKRVRVSPQDMEFIEVLGVQKLVKDFSDFQFEADDTIRAGCIVETSAGKIDYELDKAFERVRDDILKAVS